MGDEKQLRKDIDKLYDLTYNNESRITALENRITALENRVGELEDG